MAGQPLRNVLLIEDNPGDARLLGEALREHGADDLELIVVDRVSGATRRLALHQVDLILLDLGLPDAQGLDAVRRVRSAAPHTAMVVLTGLDDEALALRALREGAQDYLVKGQIEPPGLLRALRYALERKTLEEALFAEKERAEVTLNAIGHGVLCMDGHGHVTFLNRAAQVMTGWDWADAIGKPAAEVLKVAEATRGEAIITPLEAWLAPAAPLAANLTLLRRDGSDTPIEGSAAPINDRSGRPNGAVVVLRDVRAARAASAQILFTAEHDGLTGLPNRVLLNDRIGQAISAAERHQHKIGVMFLDLDGFKHINDSLGHSFGDQLLQSTAQRLLECVRACDTVSRLGGDEFVVLLAEVEQPEDVATTARRILASLSEAHAIGQHDLHITASIGISVFPEDGLSAEALIKSADTAMYQAKDNGQHSFQFFTKAMYERAVQRQSIEESLRRAVERRELMLFYQPKVSLRSGLITGAEALVRWNHPTRGLVPPGDFIPVAEDCGLIAPIGHWVLGEACRQAKAWLAAGLSLGPMAVNISAIELRGERFLDGVNSVLQSTGLDPEYLEIELTESVLMRRPEAAKVVLTALHEKGVRLALDDFGTGYSSLSYLGRFPMDTLKIDQSFVRRIGADQQDTAIVKAVIAMARSLRLLVVAEGVETLGELEFLRAHDCDEAQGYYYSRPVPAAAFTQLLESGLPAPKPRAD